MGAKGALGRPRPPVVTPSQLVVGRNAITNGAMKIRQRGNGPWTVNGSYGVDQWRVDVAGSTSSVTAIALPLGAIPGVVESGYHLRNVVTSSAGAGNYSIVNHNVEGVETLAGQTATLSFYAKADAARPIAIELAQNFGGVGSPSASVTSIGAQKFTLSTAWVRYTATIAIPTISGKTLGTNGADRLEVNLWFDSGSTFNARTNTLGQQSGTFDIWGVQLEAGANATPFEQEHISVTTAKCQRHYQTVGNGGAGGTDAATRITMAWRLPVVMRAIPTVAKLGELTIRHGNGAFTSTASSLAGSSPTTDGLMLIIDGYTALSVAGGGCVANNGTTPAYSVSAEL